MRILIQRVNSASVTVEDKIVGEIARGLLLLVGFTDEDSTEKLRPMAEKVSQLRLFPEAEKHFHISIQDIQGQLLLVPQFTLYGDVRKGRRPDFAGALEPKRAENLFNQFVLEMERLLPGRIQTGKFQAYMQVKLENDGPTTFWLES